ncbi:MAG TPA: UDP-N-acetylglucosamine 2-epimerase [Burkholderiales bacterium]|nr:UDP-N-acetylglucosamine 2-epimerase [Burkholderiales bacterium]
MRSICYVTGTRADFGLMLATLQRANAHPELDVSVCVTGMHLSPLYGNTVEDVEASGLRIRARIPVDIEGGTGPDMARAAGQALAGMATALEKDRPDIVLVLGDRGEMLAGAYAALHLDIPVVHIHGGERSGTVDEPVRHAISKLAHYHFVSTAAARERLLKMGERDTAIFVTGAPGLDELNEGVRRSREDLCVQFNLDPQRPVVLVVFHPVLSESASAGEQMTEILEGVLAAGCQCLCFAPNSDAGAPAIRGVLAEHANGRDVVVVTHLARNDYIAWMAAADAMTGNSSSGIIEAATLGLPVVNVGSRQNGRERSTNVTDVPPDRKAISDATARAIRDGRKSYENVYGDGRGGERIVHLLATLPLDRELLQKSTLSATVPYRRGSGMTDVKDLLITRTASILSALQQLQQTGDAVLLLVDDDGRLVRTVTDGDLRRLILAGRELGDLLSVLPAQQPVVVLHGTDDAEALEVMNERQIDELPVVDADGRPVQVHLRRELDTKILLSTPHLGDYEMGFVEEAFRTNWIAPLGPNVDAFERELADYVGIEHAAAVSSGTAALHLALVLADIGRDDPVFCSSLTSVASANPILYVGAVPVFIDSEPATWNISVAALERGLRTSAAQKRLPKAVIVTNLYGQSADMEPIVRLCDRYGVMMIEDAAESLGATYRGHHSGTFGRFGIYSFNGNKIITTSGGGMLVSADGKAIDRAKFLSTQAREPAPWYEHNVVGYNYRMSNVLAGMGRGQLKVLADRVVRRRVVFDRYVQGLADLPGLAWMPEAPFGQSTRWLSVCTLDPKLTAMTPAMFIQRLAASGIEARHVWKPLHLQPLFAGCVYYAHEENWSFSDHAFATGVCLPSGSNLTAAQQQRIIDAVRQLFDARERPSPAAMGRSR